MKKIPSCFKYLFCCAENYANGHQDAGKILDSVKRCRELLELVAQRKPVDNSEKIRQQKDE